MPARLPDVLILGAPRSGTTTVSRWLRAHPGVAFSQRKEVEYFDRHHHRGLGWYLDQLPQEPGTRCVVEATPTYLSEPGVPERVARALPHARFVVLLREPVERAWSQYLFFVRLGLESRSWRDCVDPEGSDDPFGYLWRGKYAEQLARWDALVGPDRLHVVLLDDLAERPEQTFAGICRFAGLSPMAPPGQAAVNAGRLPRSRRLQRLLVAESAGPLRRLAYRWNSWGRPVPRLPEAERRRLAPLFHDDLAALAVRLGRDLPCSWTEPGAGVAR